MAIVPNPHKTTGFLGWIDDRFPLTKIWKDHISEYYAPKNFNWWYTYGSLALLVLVNQLLSGIFLTMFYKPGEATSFDSVEYIMREVNFGWLIRYLHSSGGKRLRPSLLLLSSKLFGGGGDSAIRLGAVEVRPIKELVASDARP